MGLKKQYGCWLVIGEPDDGGPNARIAVRCTICEREAIIRVDSLHKESSMCIRCYMEMGGPNKRHGHAGDKKSPEYASWRAMTERCTNPKSKDWPRYGGRGIKMAEEWLGELGFDRFLAHVGMRPSEEHTIDRIDNDGNYEPGNVRWATLLEQNANKRNNVFIEAFGKRMHVSAWSRETGIKVPTLHSRMRKGDTGEHLLRPIRWSTSPK